MIKIKVVKLELAIKTIQETYSCECCDLPRRDECNEGACTVKELIETLKSLSIDI